MKAAVSLAVACLALTACSRSESPASTSAKASTMVVTTDKPQTSTSDVTTGSTAAASTTAVSTIPATTQPAGPDVAAIGGSIIGIDIGDDAYLLPPETGSLLHGVGSGSGFIVDATGIAVTAASVVGGANQVTVTLNGAEPVNAAVIGTAACADIAVLDLDGEGYVPLAWANSEPTIDDLAFAVGVDGQTGAVQSTQTQIAATDRGANLDAMVSDGVLEISPQPAASNIGGPLLDTENNVVGIVMPNVGVDSALVLPSAAAQDLLLQLSDGSGPVSLGIVGQMNTLTNPAVHGLWVAAVAPESPAAKIGIKAGDVITAVDQEPVTGQDLSAWCGQVRLSAASGSVAVDLYRPSSEELMNGVISLADEIEPVELAAINIGSVIGTKPVEATATDITTDKSKRISLRVDESWTEADGAPWLDGKHPAIKISPDNKKFDEFWGNPGLRIGLDPDSYSRLAGNIAAYLTEQIGIFDEEECPVGEPVEVKNDRYVGAYVLRLCPDNTTLMQGAYATTDGGGYMVYVETSYTTVKQQAIIVDALASVLTSK